MAERTPLPDPTTLPTVSERCWRVDADLVRAHQAAVWRWLRVLGADADTATDLAQETFLVLLRTAVHDDGPRALRGWLRATARNLFLAHCRRERRHPITGDDQALEQAIAAYERDDDGAGYREALARCLETVPAADRALLEQSVRGAPPGAAGGAHGEAARSRLRRLKDLVRTCVQRRLRNER